MFRGIPFLLIHFSFFTCFFFFLFVASSSSLSRKKRSWYGCVLIICTTVRKLGFPSHIIITNIFSLVSLDLATFREVPCRGAAPLGNPGAKQQLSLERGACFVRHVHGASAREGTICNPDWALKLLLARGACSVRNSYFDCSQFSLARNNASQIAALNEICLLWSQALRAFLGWKHSATSTRIR